MTDSLDASKDTTNITDFPDKDQENFRLIRSFNDIFVALASLLVFGSAFVLLGSVSEESDVWREISSNISLILFVIAVSAWVLAEIFTRKRSMALPSILYATVFTSAIGLSTVVGTMDISADLAEQWIPAMKAIEEFSEGWKQQIPEFQILQKIYSSLMVGSLLGMLASGFFWWRFRVAISVMWTVLSAFFFFLATTAWISDEFVGNWINVICLLFGVIVLIYAVYWDRQDVARETHRSDIAFWLHMLAALMLVQAFFNPFFESGVVKVSVVDTVWIVLIYLVLAIVALALNRRAILVAALSYVVIAVGWAFLSIGVNAAFSFLILGVLLLCLSVWWTAIRRALFKILPESIQRVLIA